MHRCTGAPPVVEEEEDIYITWRLRAANRRPGKCTRKMHFCCSGKIYELSRGKFNQARKSRFWRYCRLYIWVTLPCLHIVHKNGHYFAEVEIEM